MCSFINTTQHKLGDVPIMRYNNHSCHNHSMPNSQTSLDITLEKKQLKHAISTAEKHYNKVCSTINRIKREITSFQHIYDEKLKDLHTQLNELEQILFKYQHISEYVDDIFTFEEAQKVFEETMKEREERLEEESKQKRKDQQMNDKRNALSEKDQEELKKLYRNLARLFHPDKTHGNEQMMIRINEAYREGNLETLRNLDVEHIPPKIDNSIPTLKHRLMVLHVLIEKANKEITSMKRTTMYALSKKMSKPKTPEDATILDRMAKKVQKEIQERQEQLNNYINKYGTINQSSEE